MHESHLSYTPPIPPVALDMPIHAHWAAMAQPKGFTITERVDDRCHLLLRCEACGATHRTKLFVLMNNQPTCPHCIETSWKEDAAAASLVWLGRDPEDRHYGFYEAPCGHKLRRQFELIKRIADGECSHRCEICHDTKEKKEAEERGWQLLGPDATGKASYRLYRHIACGQVQRIARGNMQTGRFGCGKCGEDWPAAASFLYLMQFNLSTGAKLVKLGYSNDPESRLRHQLLQGSDAEGHLLTVVPMATGQDALRVEKRLHAQLTSLHREAVAPNDLYRGHIKVQSEVYFAEVTRPIQRMLAAIIAPDIAD